MTIRHLILTRFNIVCDDDTPFFGNTPEYLEQRFRLFETYCLPSVVAQTRQDFLWLVMFHPDTPQEFKQRIDEYATQYTFFRPVYCPSTNEQEVAEFYTSVAQQYSDGCEWVLTTRLDNDDILHRDHIRYLREYIDRQPPQAATFYSFPYGVQIFLQEQAAYRVTFVPNHFLSLLEPAERPLTAFGINHRHVERVPYTLVQIDGLIAWAELVHATNWLNDYMPEMHPRVQFVVEENAFPLPLGLYLNPIRNTYILVKKHVCFRLRQMARHLRKLLGRA